MHLLVVLEFMEHPLRPQVADQVRRAFADGLDVHARASCRTAGNFAHQHFAAVYFDLQRSSWYEEETVKESLQGRWFELLRSKLAYIGVVEDDHIAAQVAHPARLRAGHVGREAVADFYERHGFPFPGERHGIYELGARHDWVHVLADYETTPEGELDVFAFIAAVDARPPRHRAARGHARAVPERQHQARGGEAHRQRAGRHPERSRAPSQRWADAFRRGARARST